MYDYVILFFQWTVKIIYIYIYIYIIHPLNSKDVYENQFLWKSLKKKFLTHVLCFLDIVGFVSYTLFTNRRISLFLFFYIPSLYSCNRSFVNSVWMLCTAVELGIYNTRIVFHLKFYSQYFTVLASLTTWTWKPTALTTRPTTTKHLRASLNTKYAHATCGMAKTVRPWGDGTFLDINQVQHFTWGPDNTVIYTMSEGSEQKYVAPDNVSNIKHLVA